jgi:M6 family metalloprotease-like protein
MTGRRARVNKRFLILALLSTILLFSTASVSQIIPNPQADITHNVGANTQDNVVAATTGSSNSLNMAIPTLSAQRTPTPREEKVLVLRGKLSDKSFDVNINAMRTLFTATVKNYYNEVSYDQVFLNATYLANNYTLPRAEAYYGQYAVSGGREIDFRIEDLVNDTLTAAKNDVMALGGYSIFKHIIVVHSGTDEAATRQPNDITSQFIYRDHSTLLTIGGVSIKNACIVSEYDPLGVVVHELGHSMGLPDLYSYQASDSSSSDIFVGAWDLMATGSWNPSGQGTSPSHLTTWSKIQLHWIKPTQIVNISQSDIQSGHNVTVFLDPEELSGQNLAMRILLNNGTYYLIEDRQKLGYDVSLPGSGVLILFCDDSKASGDGPAIVVSAHPPSLGSDAPFNLGWFAKDFYGNSALNIGIKVLNKWDNGTFKVIVGQYNVVYNTMTEYKDISIPVIAGVVIIAAISVVAMIVYIRRGRQRTQAGYQGNTVIKIS